MVKLMAPDQGQPNTRLPEDSTFSCLMVFSLISKLLGVYKGQGVGMAHLVLFALLLARVVV